MQEEHKYSCGTFEGLKIVPEDMVIAVKLKRKKSKNDVGSAETSERAQRSAKESEHLARRQAGR